MATNKDFVVKNGLDVGTDIAVDGTTVIDSNAEVVVSQLKDSGVTAGTYGDSSNIPQITVDSKGRVTSTTNVAVTIANDYLTDLSFNTTDGVLTASVQNQDDVTVDLDGRYLTSETDPVFTASAAFGITAGKITNWDTAYGWGDHSTQGYLTSETNDYVDSVSFNTSDGVLTLGRTGALADLTVDLDGRYLTSYTDTNDFLTGLSFNTGNGVLTASISNQDDVTVDLDGRYQIAGTYDNYVSWTASDGTNTAAVTSGETVTLSGSGDTSVSFDSGTQTYTISSTDNNDNDFLTGLSFNTANGVLTASISNQDNVTVDLDGRYLTSYTESDTLDSVTGRGNTTTNAISVGNITTSGYIRGPETFTIDPAAHGDDTGTVVIAGNLQVDGTTTTINSTIITLDDKNILLASGAADNSAANGAGITVDGSSAALTYDGTADTWVLNKAPYYNTNRILTTADSSSFAPASHTHSYDNYGSWSFSASNTQAISSGETVTFSGSGATSVTNSGNTITISSTDTNTTYSAGTGLSLSGTTFNHSNSVTAGTAQGGSGALSYGGTFTVPKVTYDAQGHVTSVGTNTYTLPASDNTDTNTTYSISAVDSGADAIIRLTAGGSGSGTDDVKLVAGSNVTLTPSGDNITIASSDTVYTHPTHPGDDINLDTGPLTGATVISDLDFNVTTDTLGHVTDANATYSTRTLTAGDIGAQPAGSYVLTTGDTMTGQLTITAADSTGLVLNNSTNAGWAGVEFSDLTSTYTQKGYFQFSHSDANSPDSAYGGTFKFSTTESNLAVVNTGEYFAGSTNRVFHDGYHPNADKWTTPRTNTVTLTGDVTGSASASVDGSGNWTVSVPVTVANDSHSHSNYIAKGENVDTTLGDSTDNRAAVMTFNQTHTNTFTANSDIGDGNRVVTIQNPTTTTTNGIYTALHMQVSPTVTAARAMGDIKFVRNSGLQGKWVFTSKSTAGSNIDAITIQDDLTQIRNLKIEPENTIGTKLSNVSSISFNDTTSNWSDPGYHGLRSTTESGGWGDDISINSYHNVTVRLDSNSNNSDGYFRIMQNTTGNSVGQYFGYNGSLYQSYMDDNVGINTTPRTDSYKLSIGGNLHMNNNSIDYVNQLHFNDNVRFYDDGNDSYLNFKWGDTGAGGIRFRDGNDVVMGSVYGNGTNDFGLLNGAGEWAVRIVNNGLTELRYDNSAKLQTTSTGVNVNGLLTATQKSFTIDHPTKEGHKLRYGSLEGPENGVYVRGRLKGSNVIELPEVWTGLVHEDSITVNLTAIGGLQNLWVDDIIDNTVIVGGEGDINCFYTVYGERKDVEKLVTEFKEVE